MTRVFLLGGRGGGGEEVYVRGLAEAPPAGVEYAMALAHHESVPGARALTVREVAFNRAVHPFLWPLPGLRAYEVSDDVDLVHVHNFATWLKLPSRCPVVYSVGGATYAHYLKAYLGWTPEAVRARYRRARRIYRPLGIRSEIATPERMDAVVVFSAFAAHHLEELGVPAGKVHVIPPGFEIPAPGERAPREGPFTFLLVGRDPVRKGADLAVAALHRLRDRGLDVRLVLVGDAAYPGWTTDGIEGVGVVPRDRLAQDLYPRADAVLVPSRAEGFGFAAVEALGHGAPVLASRRDALPEIVGEAGILVEPEDPEELERAMERLATAPDLAASLGAAGRARFEARFTRRRMREAFGDLYRGLIS